MLASIFQRNLKKLNKNLHIYCGDDDSKPAGIWHIEEGEVAQICGVSKNYVMEWSEFTNYGKMVNSGWNRILDTLVKLKLVDRRQSYKYFGHWDEHRRPTYCVDAKPVDAAIEDIQSRGHKRMIESPLDGKRIETTVLRKDDVVDVGRMIAKDK